MAMIAHKCPDYRVTVVDINPERIDAWNSEQLPVFEPGLDTIVKKPAAKIYFSEKTLKIKSGTMTLFSSASTPRRKATAPEHTWRPICNMWKKLRARF